MEEPKKYSGINRLIRSGALQILMDKRMDGTFAEFFEDWKWIFSYSNRYKGVIFLYTVLGIISSGLALLSAYVGRIIINIVVSREISHIWLLIALMVSSSLISLVFTSVMSRISTKITIHVNNDIQGDIFDRIIDSDWMKLSEYYGGDILNRFNSDVGTISSNAVSWIPNMIINLCTFIMTFIILIRLDIGMAVIALLAGPLLLVISRFVMRRMREYRSRILKLNSEMMSFEVESFFNLDMIKSYGIMDYYSRRLRFWQKKYRDYTLDYNKFEIKTNIVMSSLSAIISIIAMLYCVFLLWTNRILFGDMTFFLQQRELLTGKFNSLVSTFPSMVNSAVSAHRVRELVELSKETHDRDSLIEMQKDSDHGISVKVEDATFAYREGAEVYIDSNFYAKPGEIVAILGSSGGGKTTLMRMLLGLVEPQKGKVTMSSMSSSSENKDVPVNADLRELFSYVPQGNTVIMGTVAENMRMVKEDATDEEIIEALKTACAWDFVKDLPEGINSKLSDNGRGISMGQCQRISIARALLRDAPIVLLDEVTSALDIDTEREVLHNIITEKPNKTYIVATHRPSVLNQATRVYRIKDNKICELTSEELDKLITSYIEW